MVRTLLHRGPDEEGSIALNGVGLAMRRLAIVDLAGGQQPITNETGSIQVVANGEIYNFQRAPPRARRPRPRLQVERGRRGPRPRLRAVGHGHLRAAARHVRPGHLGRPQPHADRRARSRRREAALLDQHAAGPAAGLGGQGAAGRPGGAARARSRGARSVPHLRIHPRAPDDAEGRAQAASRQLPDLSRRARRRHALLGRLVVPLRSWTDAEAVEALRDGCATRWSAR